MINTVADLLNAFKTKEEEVLDSYGYVKHPVLIGSMYEGLTKDILDKSIFAGLDLRVTAGKIRNSTNEMSGEIDCMLVTGEGEKIPYTDKTIYDSRQVITVIQVKKNLYSKDVKDSYENLKSVIDVTEAREGEDYHGRIIRDSFRQICQLELPTRDELGKLPSELQMIYHILLLDAFYPLRIVWGYNGFKTEFSMREAFIKFLEEKTTTDPNNKIHGYGPLNMPSLTICEDSCVIKTNGMPFGSPMENGWWDLLVTAKGNPVYYLLELIWTRLHYMFGITSEIFGEDLEVDRVHPFLKCRLMQKDGMSGWAYYYNFASNKELLEHPLEKQEWEPSFLDEAQYNLIQELIAVGYMTYVNNSEFDNLIKGSTYNVESFVKSFEKTGLVYSDGDKLKLLTENCLSGMIKDKFFAGDNKSGRVSRWIAKNL
ncbi:hypothetical protein GCM10027422_19090 [Hymenobacter arcticus]